MQFQALGFLRGFARGPKCYSRQALRQRGLGIAVGVGQLRRDKPHCSVEVGAFEMRLLEQGIVEMRSREVLARR